MIRSIIYTYGNRSHFTTIIITHKALYFMNPNKTCCITFNILFDKGKYIPLASKNEWNALKGIKGSFNSLKNNFKDPAIT